MSKRTALIAAFVSLMPMGQTVLIGTGAVFTSSAVIFLMPEKVYAGNEDFYLDKLDELYMEGADPNRLIFYANEILKINPRSGDAYWYRAYAKVEKGQYDDGIADYTKAIALGVKDSMTFNNRAYAQEQIGDYNGAMSDYDSAIRKDRKNVYPYVNRAYLKQTLGDIEGACFDWRKAFSLEPYEDLSEEIRNQCQ
tara:strand:+ start:145 stop:729 length:585 start_codon:yes stop_codon:yes gene_type:complete